MDLLAPPSLLLSYLPYRNAFLGDVSSKTARLLSAPTFGALDAIQKHSGCFDSMNPDQL